MIRPLSNFSFFSSNIFLRLNCLPLPRLGVKGLQDFSQVIEQQGQWGNYSGRGQLAHTHFISDLVFYFLYLMQFWDNCTCCLPLIQGDIMGMVMRWSQGLWLHYKTVDNTNVTIQLFHFKKIFSVFSELFVKFGCCALNWCRSAAGHTWVSNAPILSTLWKSSGSHYMEATDQGGNPMHSSPKQQHRVQFPSRRSSSWPLLSRISLFLLHVSWLWVSLRT